MPNPIVLVVIQQFAKRFGDNYFPAVDGQCSVSSSPNNWWTLVGKQHPTQLASLRTEPRHYIHYTRRPDPDCRLQIAAVSVCIRPSSFLSIPSVRQGVGTRRRQSGSHEFPTRSARPVSEEVLSKTLPTTTSRRLTTVGGTSKFSRVR